MKKLSVNKTFLYYVAAAILLLVTAFLIYRTKVPAGSERVSLYFTRAGAAAPVGRWIPRTGSIEEKIREAINLLLEGPTIEERTAGYDSTLPEGLQLLNVSLKDDVISLDFPPGIGEGGGTEAMRMRLRQIVYTATQFPWVSKVSFLINGQPITYFSSEGLTEVERPLSRADLEMEEK